MQLFDICFVENEVNIYFAGLNEFTQVTDRIFRQQQSDTKECENKSYLKPLDHPL